MIDAGADQHNSRHAVNNAAQPLGHRRRRGNPRVRESEGKAGDDQNDETGQQNQVLPALVFGHPDHAWILHPVPGRGLAPPDDGVMQEHGADYRKNQHQIEPPYPANRNRSDILRLAAVHVNLVESELLSNSLMALSAGSVEIGAVDGGARIARRQDVMHAVATGAVGNHDRTALGGQPVITVKVSRNAVAFYSELL